jgi:glc operon protein GlcG
MITTASVGLAEARKAAGAIEAELGRRGQSAVIAVADAHGELILLVRTDGASLASVLIAANKACTAARTRKATRELGQAARDPEKGFDMAYFGDPRYVGWGGGVPVRVDGDVGAVGVSGTSESEDMQLAEIGVAALLP